MISGVLCNDIRLRNDKMQRLALSNRTYIDEFAVKIYILCDKGIISLTYCEAFRADSRLAQLPLARGRNIGTSPLALGLTSSSSTSFSPFTLSPLSILPQAPPPERCQLLLASKKEMPTRSMQYHSITRVHFERTRRLGLHRRIFAIFAFTSKEKGATLARAAALHPVGLCDSTLADRSDVHRLGELELSDDAITTTIAANTA